MAVVVMDVVQAMSVVQSKRRSPRKDTKHTNCMNIGMRCAERSRFSNHNSEYPNSVNAKATSVRRAEPTIIYECDIQWKYDDTKRLNQYSQNVEH